MAPEHGSTDTNQPGYCFHGAYERAVDAKGRFNLPFQLRKGVAGAETYVVNVGRDGNLALFPREEWTRAFRKLRAHSTAAEWRARARNLSANSADLEPDAQGRVMIPQELLKQAGISRRVKVVGMDHYMELWDPDRFVDGQKDLADPDPSVLDEFFA